MSTVAEVIDRLYRDYLTPPDEQPAQTRLSAALTNVATSLTYDEDMLAVEELAAVGAGTLIEIGQELLRVTNVDEYTTTWSVQRGVLGTTAAAHSQYDTIVISPKYTRRTVFDALADAIEDLNTNLFAVAVEEITTSDSYIEMPATTRQVIKVMYRTVESDTTINRYVEGGFEFLDNFDPATYDKAIQLYGVPTGRTAYVTYKTDLVRPTDETDDMGTDLGLEDEWERLVIFDTLVHLFAGADIPARTVEYITEALEVQGFPVGAGNDIQTTLLRTFEYLLARQVKRLNARYPVRVVMNKAV